MRVKILFVIYQHSQTLKHIIVVVAAAAEDDDEEALYNKTNLKKAIKSNKLYEKGVHIRRLLRNCYSGSKRS